MTLSAHLRYIVTENEKDNCIPKDWVKNIKRAADKLDTLTARIAELEKAGEWQTMESAPKDGTRVMVRWVLQGNAVVSMIHWVSSAPLWDKEPYWARDDGTEFPNPYWWAFLPKLPAKPGEGAKT